MGDRTAVILSVLIPHEKQTFTIIRKASYWQSDNELESAEHHMFYFDEVDYGELPFLDDLIAEGIAFDSCWSAGSEYGSGTKSCRFTPEGEAIVKEIYDSESGVCIESLMGLIDQPAALRQYIIKAKERLMVLPWDNQEEYGKIYRTIQLITPK